MGLLDALNDPGLQLGLGLLSAAGPSAQPQSFGQRAFGAMQQFNAQRQAEEERKQKAAMQALQAQLIQAQIGDTYAQQKQREAAASKQADALNMLNGILSAKPQQNQYDTAGSGIRLGGQTEPMAPRAGGLEGATPEQIAALKIAGFDLRELWNDAQTGKKLEAGNYYVKNGKREYVADPTKGISLSDGRVSLIPGAAEAQAGLAGATTAAQEAAKAQYDPVKVFNPATTREEYVPRSVVVSQGQSATSPNRVPAQIQSARDQDRLKILLSELASAKDPADIAALRREISRMPGQSGQFAAAPGAVDKYEYNKEQNMMVNGVGQAMPVTNAQGLPIGTPKESDEAKRNSKFLTVTQDARKLLDQKPTASGMGAMVDDVAGFFGKAPDGAAQAAQLRSISGWLTSNVPRMEGPQSDRDVMQYKEMAALVGDATKPVSIRKAALSSVEDLIKKYGTLNPATPTVPGAQMTTSSSIADLAAQELERRNRQRRGATGGW